MAETIEQTNTAMRIAKPSIQAVDRCDGSAVDVSIIILTMAATSNIFIVKSLSAFKSNAKKD